MSEVPISALGAGIAETLAFVVLEIDATGNVGASGVPVRSAVSIKSPFV